jgi:hypothetical protein
MHSNTSSHQLPVVLKHSSIRYPAVVAKSAVSYKFTAECGFFAAVLVQIFWVIDWWVCGCCVAVDCSMFLACIF